MFDGITGFCPSQGFLASGRPKIVMRYLTHTQLTRGGWDNVFVSEIVFERPESMRRVTDRYRGVNSKV